MKQIKHIIIGILGFWSISAIAQPQANLDSLVALNQAYLKEDSTKIDILIRISEAYKDKDLTKSSEASEKAIAVAERIHDSLWIARAYFQNGLNQIRKGKFKEAIVFYEKSLAIYESLGKKNSAASVFNSIGTAYYYIHDVPKAKEYFEKSLALQELFGDKAGKARCFANLGLVYSELSDFPKALEYLDKAISIEETIPNSRGLPNNLRNKGAIYVQLSDYPKALNHFQRALKIDEQLGQKMSISGTLISMSELYISMSNYDKALEYIHKSLAINEQIGNQYNIIYCLNTIGTIHRALGNTSQALDYFKKAISISEKIGNKNMLSTAYLNIGKAYESVLDYAKALDYTQKAIDISTELHNEDNLTTGLNNMGDLYFSIPDSLLIKLGISPQNRYIEAQSMYQQCLKQVENSGEKEKKRNTLQSLSKTYEKLGDYKKAYDTYKQYIIIQESISGDTVKKQITRREIEYEFDKKEAIFKVEQQLIFEQLGRQKLLSEHQQQALTVKEQALIISNKEKDVQHLAYLKEKAEKQEKEQMLSLSEKDKLLQASELTTLSQEKDLQIQTLAKKNALIGFLLASLAAVLLGVIVLYLWLKHKQAKQETMAQTQFTQQLLTHIEDERGRIARDLHDGISHELLTLKRTLVGKKEDASASLKIDTIINDIRQISRNLHPVMLENIGLKISLETLCEQFTQNEILFVSHNINYPKILTPNAELQLFRIVQEALTNVIKYAKAEAAQVNVFTENQLLKVEIQDNGKGFEVQKVLNGNNAFGLHSILQRSKTIGGEAKVQSSDKGTLISINIPYSIQKLSSHS